MGYVPDVVLDGKRVVLRPGVAGDVPRLLAILREAEVRARWGSHWSEDDVAREFVDADNASVIVVDDEVIGAIQFDEENDPMYRHAGIDVFITAPRPVRVLDQTLSERSLAI